MKPTTSQSKPFDAKTKERILDTLRKSLDRSIFNTWFKHLHILLDGNGSVEIPLPNVFFQKHYERSFKDLLEKTIAEATGKPFHVYFSIQSRFPWSYTSSTEASSTDTAQQENGKHPISLQVPSSKKTILLLNEQYTFDNFIVGPSNRYAHAISISVVENPAKAWNPFFIHGGVGLGKTHLLQAVCHAIRQRHPNLSICYTTCENFVNDYISNMQRHTLENFRSQYRSMDVLVIDDIHFLSNKEASQEEFFHTFNALHNSKKQIILSSDSPPKDILKLKEQLVSRFMWGQVARIDPPTFETRIAIVKQKALFKGLDIPNPIAEFISYQIDSNIRELEGATTNLIMLHEIRPSTPLMELAEEVVKAFTKAEITRVTPLDTQIVVCDYFKIKLSDLQSPKRTKSIAFPRQIAMYLTRQLTPLSLEEIGSYFGGKDHSTIMYSIEKISKKIHEDNQVKSMVSLLETMLKHGKK